MMKILSLSLFMLCIGVNFVCAADKDAPFYQIRPDSFVPLAESPDMMDVLKDRAAEAGEYGSFQIDLNSDGMMDKIIRFPISLCGTGGCPYAVIDGKSGLAIGDLFGSPIYVFKESISGFPILVTYFHSSVSSGSFCRYIYDGSEYSEGDCRYLEGSALDDLTKTPEDIPLLFETQGRD